MKYGIGLDLVLAKTDDLFAEWKDRLQIKSSTWKDSIVYKEESFWRAVEPYPDIQFVRGGSDLFVLTERPPSLVFITHAWLRKHGVLIPRENIICQTMKRYDCRIRQIEVYLDTSPDLLNSFSLEGTQAVLIDRVGDQMVHPSVKIVNNIKEGFEITNDDKMQVPWRYN